MNFIIRLHRLYLSSVRKMKSCLQAQGCGIETGILMGFPVIDHRCRILLIFKMSGYEKSQNMLSPSSGSCLAGLIKILIYISDCYNKI